MIRAGTIAEIEWNHGCWIILDIGFSNNTRTCGLVINDSTPRNLRFYEALAEVKTAALDNAVLNLVIEAPLSVAFDGFGNPKARRIEKRSSFTRYWYVGPGCVVMVAAMYFLAEIARLSSENEIRLFEGFVSFKDKHSKSQHVDDVTLLRDAIRHPSVFKGAFIAPNSLKLDEDDVIWGAFEVAHLDFGIPPVIMRDIS